VRALRPRTAHEPAFENKARHKQNLRIKLLSEVWAEKEGEAGENPFEGSCSWASGCGLGARAAMATVVGSWVRARRVPGAHGQARRRVGGVLGVRHLALLHSMCLLGLAGHALPAPVEQCTRHRLVLAESRPTASSQADVLGADTGSSVPRPVPGWRSWRQNVAEDKSEVKRLRQMMAEAEQNVEQLNDRLLDAKQAQDRANHALRDKDERLVALTQQLEEAVEYGKAEAEAEHAEVVQALKHELQRLHEQVEMLGVRAMELQGQLHESEDRREQELLQYQCELAHQRLLADNFRSEFEANHIIELLAEREACVKAAREKQLEREKREEAERALEEQHVTVRQLKVRVQELEAQLHQQAAETRCAEQQFRGRLQREAAKLQEESATNRALQHEFTERVKELQYQRKRLAKKLQVCRAACKLLPNLGKELC